MRDFDLPPEPLHARGYFAVVALGALLWQVYAVFLAWRNAPVLRRFVGDLAIGPPVVTSAFLASYWFWPAVPILTAVFIFDVWRRRFGRLAYSLAVAAGAVVLALVLHAWLQEAWFRPLFDVLDAIR